MMEKLQIMDSVGTQKREKRSIWRTRCPLFGVNNLRLKHIKHSNIAILTVSII